MNYYTYPGIIHLSGKPTADDLFNAIEKVTGFSQADIKGLSRTKAVTRARHMACFFLYNELLLDQVLIAKLVNRDRSTVSAGVTTAMDAKQTDLDFKLKFAEVKKRLYEPKDLSALRITIKNKALGSVLQGPTTIGRGPLSGGPGAEAHYARR